VATGVLLLLGGCTGSPESADGSSGTTVPGTTPAALDVLPAKAPPTIPVPPGFTAPDTRGVVLAVVPSKPKVVVDHTKPLLPMDGGHVHLHGVVLGPDGPLKGAVVRVERYAGDDFGVRDILTDKDGKYSVDDLPGGRLKVRGWQKPDLAATEPQALFVAADADVPMDIRVDKHDATVIQGAVDVADPHVGQRVGLSVLLTQEAVDDNGIVQGQPIPAAQIALTLGDLGLLVVGPSTIPTGADGFSHFTIECQTTGAHPVTVTSGPSTATFSTPQCLDGTASADDQPPPTPLPDVPIGTNIVLPYDDVLPPGTYTARGHGPCSVTFDVYGDGSWNATATDSLALLLAGPGRRLHAAPDTEPCTYTRTA
jgi:hypothetical protein